MVKNGVVAAMVGVAIGLRMVVMAGITMVAAVGLFQCLKDCSGGNGVKEGEEGSR